MMKFYGRFACFFAAVLLGGCTYVEPFFLLNDTSAGITIHFENEEVHIKPGKTKKLRGLHYLSASIEMPDGRKQSYNNSLSDMRINHAEYLGTYICMRFWGSRTNLRFTMKGNLELLPCNADHEIRVLAPD